MRPAHTHTSLYRQREHDMEREEGSQQDPGETAGDRQQLVTLLSDAGTYSYAAICALSLQELFPRDWDKAFNHECIRLLLGHLRLPKQVETVMLSLADGHSHHAPDAYVALLLGEPALDGDATPLLEDLVLLAVQGGKYDARMRVLIRHVAWLLKVSPHLVDLYEESVVECLAEDATILSQEQQREAKRRQRRRRLKRYALIGLATVGGGTLLGLTGGLAAPLIGAGVGTLLGGASAAALASTTGIAIIGSLFGVAGAGLTGFKMKKRVGEIEEFAFGLLSPPPSPSLCPEAEAGQAHEQQQLHITIAISGWLTDERADNFSRPWRSLLRSREQYYLRYESAYLLQLGNAMELLLSFALSMAAQEALKYTLLSGLITAITWPASLVTLASIIDNPWGVCCRRSAEVGKQLAEVLLSREQGQRPVTLIGFSLGARVIYYCLREMSQRKDCEGIIEDAILLGTPVSGSAKDWEQLTRVVSGKLVNGYCKSDWLLKFLYRTLAVASDVAGLQPVACCDRRMCNINLSNIVAGHSEYPDKMGVILKAIGVRTLEDTIDLEAKLTKSTSDLSRGRHSASLLSLRLSKSDTNIHRRPGGAMADPMADPKEDLMANPMADTKEGPMADSEEGTKKGPMAEPKEGTREGLMADLVEGIKKGPMADPKEGPMADPVAAATPIAEVSAAMSATTIGGGRCPP